MSEQMFHSSFGNKEHYDYACSLKERTIVLRFGEAQGAMFQLDATNVGTALTKIIPEEDILALGSLRGNHTWHVTLASKTVTERLLEDGTVRVRGPNSSIRQATMETLIPRQVSVRVLWCQAWIASEVIFELLASIAEVEDFTRCRSRVGELAIPNLQYTAILKKISPAQVPDRFTLEVFGEKVPILLITKGKPRCCFLCGSCSHQQVSCPNPYCRYCNRRGHFTSNCPRRKQPIKNQKKPGTPSQPAAPASTGPAATEPAITEAAATEPAAMEPAASKPAEPSASSKPGSASPSSSTEGKSLNLDKRPHPGDDDEATSSKLQAIPETPPEPDLLSPLVMETEDDTN